MCFTLLNDNTCVTCNVCSSQLSCLAIYVTLHSTGLTTVCDVWQGDVTVSSCISLNMGYTNKKTKFKITTSIKKCFFRCVLLASLLNNRVYCKSLSFAILLFCMKLLKEKKTSSKFLSWFHKAQNCLKNKIKNLKSRWVASRRFTHINALRSTRNLL